MCDLSWELAQQLNRKNLSHHHKNNSEIIKKSWNRNTGVSSWAILLVKQRFNFLLWFSSYTEMLGKLAFHGLLACDQGVLHLVLLLWHTHTHTYIYACIHAYIHIYTLFARCNSWSSLRPHWIWMANVKFSKINDLMAAKPQEQYVVIQLTLESNVCGGVAIHGHLWD